MERAAKQELINEVREEFGRVMSVVVADFRGLDVATVTAMRADFKKANCHYKVIKNTLLKIATKDMPMAPMASLLVGPTAIMWSNESATEPAKLAVKYAKEQAQKFTLKGGFFDGSVLDAAGIESLSKMPGKQELQAGFLMTLIAAPTDLVRTLAAGPMNFLYLLQARERALGGGQ